MADQRRENQDYRRGGRREWNERPNEEGPNWSDERSLGNQPRRWSSQGDGDSYSDDAYSFAPGESTGYGRGSEGGRGGQERRGGWQEPDPWQRELEGQRFGGQRTYARDLYSDSGVSRHETDWQSGNAGRGMQGVHSSRTAEPSYGQSSYGERGFRGQSGFSQSLGSTFGRQQNEGSETRSRGGFAGRGPKDYQRSDERIREEVSDRMTDDDNLDASDITIQVRQGEVTLAGTVASRDQKRRAEDMAESISGVREVTNNIRVAREQNAPDLNQSPSIQVNQPGQSRTATKSGSGSTPSA